MTTELPTTCGAAVRSSDWLGRIVCGDNTEVLSGFPDACIDLVVTSPPYDDLRTYGGHSWNFETLAAQLVRVLKPGGVIVWVVNDATKDGTLKRRNQIEVAEVGHRLNIWKYANGFGNEEVTEHPAPFPLPLAKDHVTSWSNPGDVVLDPFCGSGTTPIAAKELERLWCGIEINPEYCAIAEARLSQDVLQLETCAMRPNGPDQGRRASDSQTL